MKRILVSAVLFSLAAGVAVAADDAEKAKKELEGEYTLKYGSKGGKEIPNDDKTGFEKVVIKGDEIIIVTKTKEEPAKFTIDPGKRPAHFNVVPTKGKAKELPGIYKMEKGELTIVLSREGDRPADFKGEGERVMKLVLVKKDE